MAITKKQAAALLAAYKKEQTKAANASIEAYNREVDTATAAEEREVAQRWQKAAQTERAAYDTAAVQALIDRHVIAETLANRGLTQSGTADGLREGVARRQEVSTRRATASKKATLSELSQRLVTARQNAAAKKAKNAASVNKSLAGKIAEKQLTLNKAAR